MPPIESDIDALFHLPLGEFTSARNALAAKLKKAGHRDEAEAVRGLSKPSISAWVVNQLYWKQRKAFDKLMASGEQFRHAQASQLAGKSAPVRAPLEARREALSELARLGSSMLTSAEHQPTPDTMRRITTTLEALSTYGKTANAPVAGRLTDDVDPPGFETLAALVPSISNGAPKGDRSTVLRFQQKAPKTAASKPPKGSDALRREEARAEQQAAAKAAARDAERALRDARAAAEKAEAALKKAAARVKDAEETKAELERRLEKAAEDATQAKQAARRVAAEAEEAAQAVADAERALEKANRELL